MKIFIPDGCHSCVFYSETEDGDCYCSIYNKSFSYDDSLSDECDEAFDGGKPKPDFCKAKSVEVFE
jgi:hypothetical protein